MFFEDKKKKNNSIDIGKKKIDWCHSLVTHPVFLIWEETQ